MTIHVCFGSDGCEKHNVPKEAAPYPCFGCELERDGYPEMAEAFSRVGRGLSRKRWNAMLNEHYARIQSGGEA